MGEPRDDTAPAVPGERPGGWVDGIGWVALINALPPGTAHRNATNGRDVTYEFPGWTPRPVIVTRWADGSTPEPPAPQPELSELLALALEHVPDDCPHRAEIEDALRS